MYKYYNIFLFILFINTKICFGFPVDFKEKEDFTSQIYQRSLLDYLEPKSSVLMNQQYDQLKENLISNNLSTHHLPNEIWVQIISYLKHEETKLHHVNQHFFSLITNYPLEDINQKGLTPLLTVSRLYSSNIYGKKINCLPRDNFCIEKIPSYIWYSFVDQVSNFPKDKWPYLKKTHIRTINLNGNQLGNEGAHDFGQSLKGSLIRRVDLSFNQLGTPGARNFGQSLPGTQVRRVNLSDNQIGAEGARDFGQSLPGTLVHSVDLSFNQLGAEGARDFGQSLKDTLIRNIDLSFNRIGDKGIRDLGQALEGTQVQNIDLIFNQIGADGAYAFGQFLKGTLIRNIDLSFNRIGDIGARFFIKALEGTKVQNFDLIFNGISEKVQRQLKSAHPHIQFSF